MSESVDGVELAQRSFERALALHQQGELDSARQEYERVLEILPEQEDTLHLLGVCLYQAGDAVAAEHHLRKAIDLRPGARDFQANLGVVLNVLGKHEEAINACSAALAIDPEFTDGLNSLANAYLGCGLEDDAVQVLRRLLAIDPEHVEGCNNLAVILGRHALSEEARQLYLRAISLRPGYSDAYCNLGRMLLKGDQAHAAIEYLETAAELDRSNVQILQDLADAMLKAGRTDQAEEVCRRALALSANDADSHIALGNVFHHRDLAEKAEACYRKAIDLDPRNPRAVSNLGALLMRGGDVESALQKFNVALDLDPEYTDAIFNKGTALQKLGRLAEAAGHFSTALAHNPRISNAYRYLSEIYRVSDMRESQIEVLDEWLKHYPGSPTALHLRRAAMQADVPDRASDAYVREEFDGFADGFEATLAGLQYRTPELIGNMVDKRIGPVGGGLRVLDAGCGTGLCAPLLRPHAAFLAGVDLSPKMLEKATARELYDDLEAAELTEFMRARNRQFDLIVSADTLVYFGALNDVFSAARSSLQGEGALVFSVEHLADDQPGDFRLNPSGRYAHSEEYVRRTLSGTGFRVEALTREVMRTEMQQPVYGLIVFARAGAGGDLRP